MPTVGDESFRRIKEHIKRHQVAYSLGAGSVLTATAFILTGRYIRPLVHIAPVFNNVNQQNTVNFGGHMTKIVRRVEDGKIWLKVTDAAKENGVSVPALSKHLNGHSSDHLYGNHYVIEGIRTVA